MDKEDKDAIKQRMQEIETALLVGEPIPMPPNSHYSSNDILVIMGTCAKVLRNHAQNVDEIQAAIRIAIKR